jgi:hypothetical protein
MDSTKNQIYKYAKYLDKYTKNSNGGGDGGIYLQKLNKYSHNVQCGGAGELDAVVQQIQELVTQVIDADTRTTAELLQKLTPLQEFTNIEFTKENYQKYFSLKTQSKKIVAETACQIAGINDEKCVEAIIEGAVTGRYYETTWTIDNLYVDFVQILYFQSNFLNCIKIIKALLQMKLFTLMVSADTVISIEDCIKEIKLLNEIIQYLSSEENNTALIILTLPTTVRYPINLLLERMENLSLDSVKKLITEIKQLDIYKKTKEEIITIALTHLSVYKNKEFFNEFNIDYVIFQIGIDCFNWTLDKIYTSSITEGIFQINFFEFIIIIKALLQLKLYTLIIAEIEIKNKDALIAKCIEEINSIDAIYQLYFNDTTIAKLFTMGNYPKQLSLESVSQFIEERKASTSPLDSVTTDKFDVSGYYHDETGLVKPYIFSTTANGDLTVVASTDPAFSMIVNQINEKATSMNSHMKPYSEQTFKSNTNQTTCRIVLTKEVPIQAFAQTFIDKPVQIQVGEKQVRLFVRPVTYPLPKQGQDKRTPEQRQLQQINDLGAEIDAKIREQMGVSTQPPTASSVVVRPSARGGIGSSSVTVRPASAQVKFDPANPTTKKFDIIGFTINRDGQPTPYVIPSDQTEKALELLPPELMEQVKELKNYGKNTRVIFTPPLLIRKTLDDLNNYKNPKKVSFTTQPKRQPQSQPQPLTVYLFIVPMTYPINDQINDINRPYYEAINKITELEMQNINDAMIKQAEQRKQAQQQSAQRQLQTPASAQPPAPASAQQSAQTSAQQPQSLAPTSAPAQVSSLSKNPTRRRGGGYSSLSNRGPYHHPNKEYHL